MSRKSKKKKVDSSTKAPKEERTRYAPDGFWRQAIAFLLGAVFAPLLVLAMFNLGGSLPVKLFDFSRWAIGIIAYLAPIVLIFTAIKIFRSENHKMPRSSFWGLILFLMSLSGLAHVGVERSLSLATADKGNAGGMLGHLTISALFPLLDRIGTVIVLLAVGMLALLFILRIPIKSFLSLFIKSLRSKDKEGQTLQEPIKGFKLNEGVPIEKSSRSNLKDTAQKLTASENHNALTTVNDPDWELPGLELLIDKQDKANPGDVSGNAEIIKSTLDDFNIKVEMEGANLGPRVTQYTLRPPAGVRLSKIASLDNNLALNLAAESIRIEAPIPGTSSVGVEVPNKKQASVRIHSILASDAWKTMDSPLSFVVGMDIAGKPVAADLNKMPHILIAGQTGSGKSVMINTLLTSLLYRNSPSDLKMILVDPKRVELKPFDELPHLLAPVITEPEKTISALKWAVAEMERRYKSLDEAGQRNIDDFNKLRKDESMPYIIIVIDELADLMMMAAREVESLIVRIAQKARAVGIHLVLATQSPRVTVITGLIKANVPARIAFTVSQEIESRIILDQSGAEKLLGTGDMLYKTAQMPKSKRIQGAMIEIGEVEKVTDFVRMQRAPEYDNEVITQPVSFGGGGGIGIGNTDNEDSLYEEAITFIIESNKASTSLLQRRFGIGYTRAAKLMDMMESKGIISSAQGNKPRQVLVSSDEEIFDQGQEENY